MKTKTAAALAVIMFIAVLYAALKNSVGYESYPGVITRADAFETASEKYLFFPSLIAVAGGRELSVGDFTPADTCESCHSDIFAQWNGSLHFNSFRDPVWQTLWKIAFEETGGKIGNECLSCHTPIGVLARRITKPEEIATIDSISAAGVQCDFCHTISALNHEDTDSKAPHNMAFTSDPGDVKRGPFDDSESPVHLTAFSQPHTSAEFCGNCHNVFHPKNGLAVESTYNEWKQSPYAKNGIVCQNCHMIPIDKLADVARTMKPAVNPGYASEMANERPNIFTHEFVGGNTAMYTSFRTNKHNEIAVKRLQAAASLDISGPEKLPPPGTVCEIEVHVTNISAGHNLPTGLPELRQMWLEVKVEDALKRLVYHTGLLKENGDLGRDTYIFDVKPKDANGQFTIKPWEMNAIEDIKTIPPKETAVRKYKFGIPERAVPPLFVNATLHYRSFPPSIYKQLAGEKADAPPITDMAAKTIIISD